LHNPEKNFAIQLKKDINSNFDTVNTQISELQKQISSTIDSETINQLTDKLNELTNNLKSMEIINKDKDYF
jgi:uncharacterized protein YoxC